MSQYPLIVVTAVIYVAFACPIKEKRILLLETVMLFVLWSSLLVNDVLNKGLFLLSISGKRKPLTQEMAMHMVRIDGVWRCTTCVQNFRDKTDLRRHVESKHLEKNVRYRCNLCDWSTKTTYSFRKHQLKHEREGPILSGDLGGLGISDDGDGVHDGGDHTNDGMTVPADPMSMGY